MQVEVALAAVRAVEWVAAGAVAGKVVAWVVASARANPAEAKVAA